MTKIELRSLDLEEMEALMREINEPPFRAKQLAQWIHQKGVESLGQIGNFSQNLKNKLGEYSKITVLKLVKKQVSRDGTEKFLFGLEDGNFLECVLMRYRGTKSKQRNTLCVSSQVGCAMGCGFCATGLSGFQRNLTAGEILSQVYTVNNYLKDDNEIIGNVVYMGMGEPMANFANVLKSIRLLNAPYGQNIGIRRITLSTCGIVPKIIELADMDLDLVLAVSLHAPTDNLRSQIMPINNKYPLKELKKACLYYNQKTGRRITFEYALIEGFNDAKQHAKELAHYLRRLFCHVNLIPVNPVVTEKYQRPDQKKIKEFLAVLTDGGIEVSIREERGTDILAACGQLRGKVVE
ncbi:MAG: 23S rRNA (adenine(2503)-C(2))-methyltransferase RlmN [Clostridia bacterium]|nr:23S rRNA (adenine(2503)-C(2))-methyltransferase RlmN [Clostridia bacterium]